MKKRQFLKLLGAAPLALLVPLPKIATGVKDLTGWTTPVNEGDILRFNVASIPYESWGEGIIRLYPYYPNNIYIDKASISLRENHPFFNGGWY